MIISATPMIAGIRMPDVNTRAGGTCWGTTKFTTRTKSATPGKSNGCTKIKRRAARVFQHPNRANRPASLPQKPKRREGQAVQKPMASLYAHRVIHAGTLVRRSVAISTVLVVDGA